MNTQTSKQIAAYSQNQRMDENPRETEARALTNCARRMRLAQQENIPQDVFEEAVRHNLELWTLLQCAVVESDNPLPIETKKAVLSVSRFVDKQSLKAISTLDPALLDILIMINHNIALGLLGDPGPGEGGTLTPPPY